MATNLYQYYTEQKKPMPSIEERANLYESYGLGRATDYAGNMGQNTQLLSKLQGGEAPTPAQMPAVSPVAPKVNIGSGGGVSTQIKSNSGLVASGQIAQPQIDPLQAQADTKKAQFDELNAKLRDFQMKQESDPAYTYKKSIEDLQNQMPEAPDYATEYKNLAAAQGLDQTQAEITGLDTQIAEYEAQVEKETYGEENRIAPMSIINARKNKIATNANIELNRLYDRKAVLQNSLQMKNDTISNMMNMTKQTYSDSLAQYNMKLESYEKIADMFDKQEQREFDRDQAEKKTAMTNLAVVQNTLKDYILSGKTFDEVPDSMKAQIEQLELASGLPRGSTAQLIGELKPEEKEIWKGLSDDGSMLGVLVRGADGMPEMRRYATNFPIDQSRALEIENKQLQNTKLRKDLSSIGSATTLDTTTLTKVMGIANQFDGEAVVKNYNVVNEAVNMNKTLEKTPTDDMARVYNFAKVMDPNSVVRESEYKTAQDYAQATLQAAGLKAKRVFTNSGFLTDEAREFMQKTLDSKLASSKKNYDNIYNEYGRRINKISGSTDGTEYITDYAKAYEGGDLRLQVQSAGYDYDKLKADGYTDEEIKAAIK